MSLDEGISKNKGKHDLMTSKTSATRLTGIKERESTRKFYELLHKRSQDAKVHPEKLVLFE